MTTDYVVIPIAYYNLTSDNLSWQRTCYHHLHYRAGDKYFTLHFDLSDPYKRMSILSAIWCLGLTTNSIPSYALPSDI
jgi:hypothetical protein